VGSADYGVYTVSASAEESADLCYHSRTDDCCRERAVTRMTCRVEGTEISFCARHWMNWKVVLQQDSRLKDHCPRCANAYLSRLEQQAANPSVLIADEPITGPLAEAIDNAMHESGVLKPVRDEVLRRLAANTDAYVAAVMSRQVGTVA
jgi:hypothetical protein